MRFQFMTPQALSEQMASDQQPVVVDIRDSNSFAVGRIQGSKALDNSNVQTFIEQTAKDTPVVVCCYHGNSSQSAAQFLVDQGFSEVYSLQGGYEMWKVAFPQYCEA